ncbi:MAG: transcriptional repressor LexA [Planctomycetes bacterium]|nr:transcriptional repressor LexA [Planctomycetota bacterium]
MKDLTDRQSKVFEFICQQQELRGFPPTIREIGEEFLMNSTGTVRDYLRALARKGYISRNSRTSRGIEILKRDARSQTTGIPILGRIAAGQPITAHEELEGEVPMDPSYFGRPEEIFALRVKGDSMKDAGILGGDIVMVRRQQTAQDGDIVAAILDDEATIKYFHHEGDRVRFQPANSAMQPIYVYKDQANLHIAGKVVGVLRAL